MNTKDLLLHVDKDSPTWRAVLAWAAHRKGECAESLLQRANTRDDDVFYRGKANAFTELIGIGNTLESRKSDESE